MYFPKFKPNQLILGNGNPIIVTGWTMKNLIAKKLKENQYAAIGNLYSPARGLSFLIRNLLLNPNINRLIILSATKEDANSGSCQALLDFFENGVYHSIGDTGKDAWQVLSEVKAFIDIEIPQSDLDLLRKHICYSYVTNLKDLLKEVNREYICPIRTTSKDYPVTEVQSKVLPANPYGQNVHSLTIASAWLQILYRIRSIGKIRPTSYDGYWQELLNLTVVIEDEPNTLYFPSPNYLPCNREFIQNYLESILHDAPYQEGVKYSYGQRLRSWFGYDQVEQVIEKLIKEIDAASAVMNLWDVKDHLTGGSPCLNHIWVRVVDNKLLLNALFRSNDMFSAWVANAMGLRKLQELILTEINKRSDYELEMGPLMTTSLSAHIYESCWENADILIEKFYYKTKPTYNDPVGNFIVETQGQKIKVTQTTSAGLEVKTFVSKFPLKLIREISLSSPTIEPYHLGYLATEIQKAYDRLKSGE